MNLFDKWKKIVYTISRDKGWRFATTSKEEKP